jgi:hypothetical protein
VNNKKGMHLRKSGGVASSEGGGRDVVNSTYTMTTTTTARLLLLLLLSSFVSVTLSSSSASSLPLRQKKMIECFQHCSNHHQLLSPTRCPLIRSIQSQSFTSIAREEIVRMGAIPQPNEEEELNFQHNKQSNNRNQQLIPLLMYTVVPFLPAITLQSLNDQYQQIKQQFNIAASLLPPTYNNNVADIKDSMEYITASNLYNESMQSLLILLVSKRVALYFVATCATLYAGYKASITICEICNGNLSGPGQALDNLNSEVLKGESFVVTTTANSKDDDVTMKSVDLKNENENENLFATLVDDNPQSTKVGSAIALILPLLLGASLALSYMLISFFNDGGGGASISTSIGEEYWAAIQGLLPYLSSLPSMVLCLFFVATEFRSVSNNKASADSSSPLLCAENVAALLYVTGAYIAKVYPTISIGEWNLDLSPLQNGVNIAFGATVVRALAPFFIPSNSNNSTSLDSATTSISIRTMALALIGVTMFDGISVFGTVANAASIDTAVATVAAPTTSVMEKVATYKLESSSAQLWNPGLLSVIVGHSQNAKITEALGLGDVVFPACLVAWSCFADNVMTQTPAAIDNESVGLPKGNRISYTSATTAGYVIGSAATEIVGSFSLLGSGRGLPALIFLIPAMLLTVTALAYSRGELREVWGSGSGSGSDAE